jgi:hypothetical protein
MVQKVLNGIRNSWRRTVSRAQLKDVSQRKKVAEGGQKAIESSSDPMIQLAFGRWRGPQASETLRRPSSGRTRQLCTHLESSIRAERHIGLSRRYVHITAQLWSCQRL